VAGLATAIAGQAGRLAVIGGVLTGFEMAGRCPAVPRRLAK
jgi:hypothetical protein